MQSKVIQKFNDGSFSYEPLQYNAPDGKVFPNQVIDYGLKTLFDDRGFDTVLILDVDCIPLSLSSINYTFEQAEKGVLVGNIQRSNHIQNNQHVFVAPSAFCITKKMYDKCKRIPFQPTRRGDIAEEYTYYAENNNIPIEMFMPKTYESLPFDGKAWNLKDSMPKYGVGTTFVNKNNEEMFYHLFESRVHKHNQLFFNKCKSLLKLIKSKTKKI